MSASFAALVSAIESPTDRGNSHPVKCTTCNKDIEHEVPGATRRFKDFLKVYASDSGLAKQRDEMYSLRSEILHGSDLTQLDQDFAIVHAVDPGRENELERYQELWRLTRVALRNWLKNPPIASPSATNGGPRFPAVPRGARSDSYRGHDIRWSELRKTYLMNALHDLRRGRPRRVGRRHEPPSQTVRAGTVCIRRPFPAPPQPVEFD